VPYRDSKLTRILKNSLQVRGLRKAVSSVVYACACACESAHAFACVHACAFVGVGVCMCM